MAELEDECHALKQRAISAESAADALQVCGKNNNNSSAESAADALQVCGTNKNNKNNNNNNNSAESALKVCGCGCVSPTLLLLYY